MARLADHEIIPAVLAKIEHCDTRAAYFNGYLASFPRAGKRVKAVESRYRKAADRLRDFATVELLCEGLGITRKEIE